VISMPSMNELEKHSGMQIENVVAIAGSTSMLHDRKPSGGLAPSLGEAEVASFKVLYMPKLAVRPLRPPSRCFPHASPISRSGVGKQETAPKDRFNRLISLRKSGAGEGIRTLDPNLGKVVLLRGAILRNLR
jgi:hypothetical protein